MPTLRHEINILNSVYTTGDSNERVYIDPANYNGTLTWYFEVYTTANITVYLHDSANNVHATATGTGLVRVTCSSAPTADTYHINTSGSSVTLARVICIQTASTAITASESQFDMGSYMLTTALVASPATMTNPKYWTYDSSEYDGTVSFYFEAVLKGESASYITSAQLQVDDGAFTTWSNVTNGLVTLQSTTATRVRAGSAFTPTNGRNYRIVVYTNNSMYDAIIYAAKIIIIQTHATAITKIVETYELLNYVDGGTGLQSKHQTWQSEEWSGVTNVLTFVMNATNSADSAKLVDTTADPDMDFGTATGNNVKSASVFGRTSAASNVASAALYRAIYGATGTSEARGQGFLASQILSCNAVTVKLNKTNSPTDNLVVKLWQESIGGTLLGTSAEKAAADISVGATDYDFTFSTPVSITVATQYYFTIERTGSRDTTNYVSISTNNGQYSNGAAQIRDNGTWAADTTGDDRYFMVSAIQTTPVDNNVYDVNVINSTGNINYAYIKVVVTISAGTQTAKTLTATINITASRVNQINKILLANTNVTASNKKDTSKTLTAQIRSTSSKIAQTSKTLSANITATATMLYGRLYSKILSAVVNITSTFSRQTGKTLTSTINTTSSLTRSTSKTLNANLRTTATQTKQTSKTLVAISNITSSIRRQTGKILSAVTNTTATFTMAKTWSKTLLANVSITASNIKQTAKTLTANVRLTGTMQRVMTWVKTLTANISIMASNVKHTSKSLLANVSIVGTFTALRTYLKTLTANISIVSSMTKRTNKTLSANISTTSTQTKQTSKSLLANISITGTMTKAATWLKTLTANILISASNIKQTSKTLLAITNVTASATKAVGKALTAVVNATATFIAQLASTGNTYFKTLTANIVVSSSMTKSTLKEMTANIIASASAVKASTKTMLANVNISGSAIKQINKLLTAAVAISASFTRITGKLLNAVVIASASVTKQIGKILHANVSVTVSTQKSIGKTLQAIIKSISTMIKLPALQKPADPVITIANWKMSMNGHFIANQDEYVCVRVDVDAAMYSPNWICTIDLFLPNGTIITKGAYDYSSGTFIMVLGQTDIALDYDGVVYMQAKFYDNTTGTPVYQGETNTMKKRVLRSVMAKTGNNQE